MTKTPSDVRMKGFGERTALAEVEGLLDERVKRLGTETVPVSVALGRVLSEAIVSQVDLPDVPRSLRDGYAVRSEDLPGELAVRGEILAADVFQGTLSPGQAVQIVSGAPLPDGANTVVMAEDTILLEGAIAVARAQAAGTHVLRAGEDVRRGTRLLEAGRRIRAQDLPVLARTGALEIPVARRPVVRIVPCGSEIVPAGSGRAGVPEAGSYLLEALARRDGALPRRFPILPDDADAIGMALLAPGADLIVVTGGTGVGREDLGPVVLSKHGELVAHGIALRPGSTTGIGFVGSTLVVLAPGYPGASMVAWDLLVRRAIQRMLGREIHLPYPSITARLAEGRRKRAAEVELVRVRLSEEAGVTWARSLRGGGALLSTASEADGFVLFPAGRGDFPEGEEARVFLYGP